VVGFIEFRDTWVVAGAPVCAESDLPGVQREFEARARDESRAVCYFGAESRLESLLRSSPDHSQVLLGAQPSFQPTDWPEMLRHHASLRAQLNRARNKGVVVTEYLASKATTDLRLRGCLQEWLSTRGLPPLHFLIEPQTLDRLFDRRVFVAEKANTPVAFLVASPVSQRRGWLIEQIIRGKRAPNGCAELMLNFAVQTFTLEHCEYVTLGLSPLSHRVRTQLDTNPLWLRLILAWMRAHGRRFYNFEGLDAFKTKFRPKYWEPVYAIYDRPRFSPAALYAIAGAFTAGKPVRTGMRALADAFSRELNRHTLGR
jgi:phosphatidylglycerol lysyltransferase